MRAAQARREDLGESRVAGSTVPLAQAGARHEHLVEIHDLTPARKNANRDAIASPTTTIPAAASFHTVENFKDMPPANQIEDIRTVETSAAGILFLSVAMGSIRAARC